MIHHMVMWRFADSAEGKTREENMAIVRERLLALPAIIPEIKAMKVGCQVLADDAYDLVLLSDFEDADALQTYRVHPAHVAVADYVKLVTTERRAIDVAYE